MSIAQVATLPRTAARQAKWKVVILASLGGALEIYDFIVYGVFALEIGSQFFPKSDPLISLISTFSVFAVGYVSRPLGGIVLSSIGDRYGRRVVFLGSVLAMSGCTIAIGLVPSYASIGVAAPILLVSLRLLQGFFLAGELPCSITYVVEEIPARASFVSGLVIFCLNSGVLVATLISLSLHSLLAGDDVATYGWRIAFIFGGLVGLLSYWLRTSLEESTEFQHMKSHVAKRPFRKVLAEFPKNALIAIGIASIVNTSNSMLFVVLPSYLAGVLHYGKAATSGAQNVGIATMSVSLLFVAWLGDRIHSRQLHRIGTIVFLVGSYPLYLAISSQQVGPIAAFVIIGLVGGLVNGTYAFLMADLFPTNVRFSGIGLSLNLATVVFTGATPLLVTELMKTTHNNAAPGLYLTVVALIALIANLAFKRYGGTLNQRNRQPRGVSA